MKVRILITPKEGVLDPEGKAVQSALADLGYGQLRSVQTGKIVTLDLEGDDAEAARRLAEEMCEKLLANPVIEQYEVVLTSST